MQFTWLLILLSAGGDGYRVKRTKASVDCPDNVAYDAKADVCTDGNTALCMGTCEECCAKPTPEPPTPVPPTPYPTYEDGTIECPEDTYDDPKQGVCVDRSTDRPICEVSCDHCCSKPKPTPAPSTPEPPTPSPTYEDGTIECTEDTYDDPKGGFCVDRATNKAICAVGCDQCCHKATPKPTPQAEARYPKGFCAGPGTFWTCTAGNVTEEATYGQLCASSGGPSHGSKGQQWCADRCARGQTDNDNPDCPRGDCMCVRKTGEGEKDMELVAPEKMPLIEGKTAAIPDSWCYQNMLQGDGWSWFWTWICTITNGGELGDWTRLNKDLCGGDPHLWTNNLLTNTAGGAANPEINKNCDMH